jgi:hypothetical protein
MLANRALEMPDFRRVPLPLKLGNTNCTGIKVFSIYLKLSAVFIRFLHN